MPARVKETRKKITNCIKYSHKPFTCANIASLSGVELSRVRRLMSHLLSEGYIKAVARQGRERIYVKNGDFHPVKKNNPSGYSYEIMERLYGMIGKTEISSGRQLETLTGVSHKAVIKYLIAFVSMDYVTRGDGIFQYTENEINYDIVGKKITEGAKEMVSDKVRTKSKPKTSKASGVLYDAQGREYPEKILDKQLVKRDKLVKRLMKKAKALNEKIADEKTKMVADIEKYLADTAEQYGENWKGNAELLSFDGSAKIEVKYKERIQFTEKLQIAKQKIDDCLIRWSENSNINLQAVIREAFQVDRKGEVAKGRILSLRQYNIKDSEWKVAMDLINEAIEVTSTKQYIAFYEREDSDKSFSLVTLNFSSIE